MTLHYSFWPRRVPKTLSIPNTTLYDNLVVTARRYPHKTAIHYYGREFSYYQLLDEVEKLAGFLQQRLGISRGDHVILYLQNSPQYIVAFHAILRADAVVIPLNPMNTTDELQHYIEDSEAKAAIVGQEIYTKIEPLIGSTGLEFVIKATYSDYLPPKDAIVDQYETALLERLPDFLTETAVPSTKAHTIDWRVALSAQLEASPSQNLPDDLAVMPYTSGTTGLPKGCRHSNRTVQANVVSSCVWYGTTPEAASLTVLPLFHVTGLIHSMLATIFTGSKMVLMTRWDREVAGYFIEHNQITHWTNIATMVIDFLANPQLENYDVSSLEVIGGGGATLPEAVGERLFTKTGVRYAEGYGLSETMSQTHMNPPDRPKLQCLGIPAFDVDARIIDPVESKELGPGEEGELIIDGPQVFKGYWKRPEEDKRAFIEIDGRRFFRTGDIAKYDEEGYFFMVDRVKRMINASGFKVWPTEVESFLYGHPGIEQACVIGVPDQRRGETVKAYIVPTLDARTTLTEDEIMEWSRERMSAYKVPRQVEFLDKLPMSGSGKVMWRKLQEDELARQKNQS